MQILKNMSIRRKQTLIMMLTSSVVLFLACATFSIYEVTGFLNTMKQNLATLADIVDHNTTAALDFNDPQSAEETLSALQADPAIIGAWLYSADGRVFAKYDRPNDNIVFTPPVVLPNGILFQRHRLVLCRPVILKGETVGTLYLESDMGALTALLVHYTEIVGLVFILSLLTVLALSSQLQRLVSDPILDLAQVARAVAQDKNYSLRATKQSNDEIGQLVDGFNEMLVQIQRRDAVVQAVRDDLERRVEERTRELGESQSLYHSLVDQMPAGIFRKNAEGRYIFVNSSFCRIKGLEPGQILGRTPRELAAWELARQKTEHPEAARETQLANQGVNHHELIMKTGGQIEVEEAYPRADGKVRYLRVVKSPVFDSGGKIAGTQGMLFDITVSKEAEAALAYERHLLRTLLDNSPDNIYFKDAQSRFIKSSKAQAAQFGMASPDELVGRTDFDFFAEEHARPAFEDEQDIIRTGRPLVGKVEKEVLKNGKVSWVLTTKMPFRDQAGEIIGTFGISKDITVIKEAEAQLEQLHRQLLETSRQAGMAEIATNVLHNIGNVLNSVNVSASLVVDSVKKSRVASLAKVAAMLREHEHDLGTFITSDAKGRQLPVYLGQLAEQLLADQKLAVHELDLLVKNIEHIKDIVTMQQSYARVSGVKEIINLRELVEDSLRMNIGALERHRVEVIREFEDLPLVNIDKHKVLQILVNLIRNAKHACQESERLDRRLTVRMTNGEGRIKISVADNGIGIPPENMTRIFNHGFTTRKDGHGFGLHSGALAAKEMGGSLAVRSDGIGKGATFTLDLPCDTNKDPHE
jgi:PAS domain S-box-containing protein